MYALSHISNPRDAVAPSFLPAGFFQPKLQINTPGDQYEKEADAMADKVVSMQSPFFGPASPATASGIQRKCAQCEEEEQKIHRKERNGQESTADSRIETYVGNLNAGGQPLDKETRNFYEPRFGYDFSNVKVHTDTVAAKSAQSVNALAYTTGNNIVFNSGQYSPGTSTGKKLLAHELTHVIQQTGSLQTKKIQRTMGDGHDLSATRFSGEPDLESAFDGEQVIKHGARGAAVQKIQQALLDLGHQLPRFGADGIYGSETSAAVQDFQREEGLSFMEIDGRVGPQTMSLLDNRFEGETPPGPSPLPPCPVTDMSSAFANVSFNEGFIPGVTCQDTPPGPNPPGPKPPGPTPPGPKPPAPNPLCSKICKSTGAASTPQTLKIGSNVFTLCACSPKQVHFNTGPGHVNLVTKTDPTGQLTLDTTRLDFHTGFQGQNIANSSPAWEYTGAVGVDEAIPAGGSSRDSEVETGFIQTIESYKWNVKYSNGWERNMSESNVRDEQKGATAPWYGVAGGHDQPKETAQQIFIADSPHAILSIVHPDPGAKCAKLEQVNTEGTFHLWMIAAEKTAATSNLVFLFNASLTFNRTFDLNSPGLDPSSSLNWKAGGSQSETANGSGKGAKTPVLTAPVPTLTFTTKNGTPCPGKKLSSLFFRRI